LVQFEFIIQPIAAQPSIASSMPIQKEGEMPRMTALSLNNPFFTVRKCLAGVRQRTSNVLENADSEMLRLIKQRQIGRR
jgi:hypothetical protein